jgi:hypothetical protein
VHEGGLTDDEMAAVLRRAAELSPPLDVGPRLYERAALEEAAAEVGIEAAAVRHALAELDAGALVTTSQDGQAQSGGVTVRRIIDRPAAAVDGDLRQTLRRELFRLRRDTEARTVWVRGNGLAARVMRSANRLTGHLRLTDIPTIEARIVAVDDDTTLVQLVLDVGSYRRRETGEMVGSATIGATSIAVGIGPLGLHPIGLIVGAAGAGLAALGCVGAAAAYRTHVADTEAIAEGLLDELGRPAALRPGPRFPRPTFL